VLRFRYQRVAVIVSEPNQVDAKQLPTLSKMNNMKVKLNIWSTI